MPTPPAPAVPPPQPPLRASELKPLAKRVDDTDLASHKAIWQVSKPRGIYFFVRFSRNKFLERSCQAPIMGPNQLDTTAESPTQAKSKMRPAESGKLRIKHHCISQNNVPTEHEGTEDRSRSATPISNWNSSPHTENKRTVQVNDDEDEKAEDLDFDDTNPEVRNKLSSSLPAPTPAQRVKKPAPEPSPSCTLGNETQMSPRTRQQRSTLARKVPRPASPEPLPAEQTGPGRVLVPNSDTSQQSYSQPSQPKQVATSVYLGGLVNDTSQPFPWLSMRDIGRIWRRASELRLRNDSH